MGAGRHLLEGLVEDHRPGGALSRVALRGGAADDGDEAAVRADGRHAQQQRVTGGRAGGEVLEFRR